MLFNLDFENCFVKMFSGKKILFHLYFYDFFCAKNSFFCTNLQQIYRINFRVEFVVNLLLRISRKFFRDRVSCFI